MLLSGRRIKREKMTKSSLLGKSIMYLLILVFFIFAIHQLQKSSTEAGRENERNSGMYSPHFADQGDFDVTFYNLDLSVEIDSSCETGNLVGATTIRFRAAKEKIDKIALNFSSDMVVDSVFGAERFKHHENLLEVKLHRALVKGQYDSVRIIYHGWPQVYHSWIHGWKMSKYESTDGHVYPWLTTINPPYGAQTWFPCKDDPADKADSVRFRIDVPDTLMAVCNGELQSTVQLKEGRKAYTWKESYPISTYLMAVNIGKFEKISENYAPDSGQNFPIQLYCFSEDTPAAPIILRQLRDMMDYFTSVLGPYPFPDEKYGMVRQSTAGGMENQTITGVQRMSARMNNLYAHELAHQWLGDMITNSSFHESWINEGLASYFTALYMRHSQGESGFNDFMRRRRFLKSGTIWVNETTSPDSVYRTGTVYDKACWFFYMLNEQTGDSLFMAGIRKCLEKFRYNSIDENELKSVFEDVSGQSLTHFFSQWIHEKNTPTLAWKVRSKESQSGTHGYIINVRQQQSSKHPYILPVEMKFESDRRDTTIVFEIFEKKQEFATYLPFVADRITVDPHKKLLMFSEMDYRKQH